MIVRAATGEDLMLFAGDVRPRYESSVALNTLLVAVSLIFMALAFKYWFSILGNGIVAGTLLIGVSLALRLAA